MLSLVLGVLLAAAILAIVILLAKVDVLADRSPSFTSVAGYQTR